jgi:hypothetical protein
VDRATYQKTTEVLRAAIEGAKCGRDEKLKAIRRLHEFLG